VAQRLRRFTIGQTSKVVGTLYGLMGLIFLLFILVASVLSSKGPGVVLGVVLALIMPIAYGVGGFIFTAIACALYNWVAGMVGGIEVQLDPPARVA
jgi:hypothetical protein